MTMNEAIKVTNLKKYFKDIKAVDDITFSVGCGELFGFLGENGAGKTTTVNMLCTLADPTAGEIIICGHDTQKESGYVRSKIGIVFQENVLDDDLTVKDNLLSRGALYETDRTKLKKRLSEVTEILALGDILGRRFVKLSGGQKRRCEIARALMNTPEILFLDEPTTGLDPAARKNVWETITHLRKCTNMTVFLTTHYMEEASKADHIAIMNKGRIEKAGTPFALKEKYAKDKLLLIPKDMEKIGMALSELGLGFSEKSGLFEIPLESTISAIPFLDRLKDLIDGFEVIQGTMDDVFLNTASL